MSRKEHLILELKEFLRIVLYLAASFTLLATMRSLILIQVGINDFAHSYITALIESVALGKIVILAQNMRLFKLLEKNKSILRSALFKSAVMAVIVFLGGMLEERIFAHHIAQAPIKHHKLMMFAHLSGLFAVFYPLFVARGLNTALGNGRLLKLLREPQLSEHNEH